MLRLFVGIPLPAQLRSELAILCAGLPGAKWVPEDNLHLSLRFIGEVGRGDAEDLHQSLQRVQVQPFAITVAGIGCFETGGRVRVLWAGVRKEELLQRLQEKVESAIVRCGHPPDRRKFRAHITLARFSNGGAGRVGGFVQAHNGFQSDPVPVDHFTLYRSHLGGDAPHYEALADYPLIG
jgi:2'-5' RNA ligase